MDTNIRIEQNVLIVSPQGELDHHMALPLRQEIDHMINTGPVKHLIFDFSSLGFMDSAGIGLVMGRYNKINEAGGKVAITGAGPSIDRILSMAGIFTITLKYADIASALEQVGS